MSLELVICCICSSLENEALLQDLFEALLPHVEHEHFEARDEESEESAPLSLAIVGRPNAGKSTLVNRMLGEERMITGPEAGITRDSISIEWQWNGKPVRLVDTAGLRKRAKVEDKLERLSAADTKRAIDYAQVVVLLLDATRGLEAQDLRIAAQVIEEGRGLIVALNKWDVAEGASALFNGVKAALDEGLAQLRDVPLLTLSGKTGKGIDTLLEVAFGVREAWSRRIPTGELNRWFEARARGQSPARAQGQADQAALHYPGEDAGRRPSSCSATAPTSCPKATAAIWSMRCGATSSSKPVPMRLDFRGRTNPFDRDR